MQIQLRTSTEEDIRYAEHQTELFLPTCFVHCVCGTLPSVHVSSERRSIQTVEEQEEIVSKYNGARLPAHVGLPHVSMFHKAACGKHCITMACIHFTISQYNVCTQVMTHIDCNFVTGYPITESYCRTFYYR